MTTIQKNVRLDPGLNNLIKKAAKQLGISESKLLEYALKQFIQEKMDERFGSN